MAAIALGNTWGQRYAIETDNGTIALQGYDNGVVLTTPEAPTLGWNLAHVLDDPQGDPDVIQIAGKRFRLIPG